MNLPPSNSDKPSSSFEQLHPIVQKWIWTQQWKKMHSIQEKSIPVILEAKHDVIIMAGTAGGKTEAAFLPICSSLIHNPSTTSIQVLCISPLKALINDQHDRLETMFNLAEIAVTKWHGDAPQSAKIKLLQHPNGVLLITPESLEALFVNHGLAINSLFNQLKYVVIDELHAFIGNVRGKQLQSLLCRLEKALMKRIPRIALSATIGNVEAAKEFLRNSDKKNVKIISSTDEHSEIRLLIKGYLDKAITEESNTKEITYREMCKDIYNTLRGTTNLVFANNRRDVEIVSSTLIEMSEDKKVPNEFYPHHGSLAVESRSDAEMRLKENSIPTTVIATSTLELGIDIGRVNSIAQIGAPTSVTSMRQRLGRSGRRDGIATMRIFIHENELNSKSTLLDRLRLELIHSIAMVNLLLEQWYEPPQLGIYDFSTLVQQTLSYICQKGGSKANKIFDILCKDGAFSNIDQVMFMDFLRSIGKNNLIEQAPNSEIMLGHLGEKITSDFHFYAAFQSPIEYRLIANGQTIGVLPILYPLLPENFIIFSGRKWQIVDVNDLKKVVFLMPSKGGRVPPFGGHGSLIHSKVREECKKILMSNYVPSYLDKTAKEMLLEARKEFASSNLLENVLKQEGNNVLLFTWEGDLIVNTLSLQMNLDNIKNSHWHGIIEIENSRISDIVNYLYTLNKKGLYSISELLGIVANKKLEKYDSYVSDKCNELDYSSKMIDINATIFWLNQYLTTQRSKPKS